jgi:hypothetical protein
VVEEGGHGDNDRGLRGDADCASYAGDLPEIFRLRKILFIKISYSNLFQRNNSHGSIAFLAVYRNLTMIFLEFTALETAFNL